MRPGRLVLVEDLVRVLQDGVDNLDLPPGVLDGPPRVGAHEGGAEDDGEVVRVHAVDVRGLDDAVEVQAEGAEGGVVGVGEGVDDGVEGVPAHDVVVVLGRLDERVVVLVGEQRVRQLAEELLQQARNTVDVVEEVLRVAEVEGAGLRLGVEHVLQLLDVGHAATLPVDALDAQAEEVDGLDALVDRQGYGQAVAFIKAAEVYTEDGVEGRLGCLRRGGVADAGRDAGCAATPFV